jgi:ElaB/YqjD/DUF883 family membrane-anchored ribosome-binding protein
MTTEHARSDHSKRTNGATKNGDFIHRARLTVAALPSRIDAQLKRNPYVTVGIACAIGMGIGIVASSRILRSAVGAIVSTAAMEITRKYLRV